MGLDRVQRAGAVHHAVHPGGVLANFDADLLAVAVEAAGQPHHPVEVILASLGALTERHPLSEAEHR